MAGAVRLGPASTATHSQSFVSDVSTGNGTDIVTVNLGSVALAAGSYDLFLYSIPNLGIQDISANLATKSTNSFRQQPGLRPETIMASWAVFSA